MSLVRKIVGILFSDLVQVVLITGYLLLESLIFFKVIPEIQKESLVYQVINPDNFWFYYI